MVAEIISNCLEVLDGLHLIIQRDDRKAWPPTDTGGGHGTNFMSSFSSSLCIIKWRPSVII